jgi:hypothetical protein
MPSFKLRSNQRAFRAATLLLAILPLSLPAPQVVQVKQSVYVREVRIDSILLAFGVDSAQVRAATIKAIRDAGRLAPDTTGPALDIDVTVPRPLTGGMFNPRGYVRVEVGRNLVERGKARTVVWQGMVDLPELPTWRDFGRRTLPEVVRAMNNYLLSGLRGA